MNKFDEIALGSIDVAYSQALVRKNPEVHALHLLYGLISNPKSYSSKALKKHKKEVELELDKLPSIKGKLTMDELKAHSSFSEWITYASSHAIQAGRGEITEPDLLRFLPKALPQIHINYDELGSGEDNGEQTEAPEFLLNLNELAAQGKLDPVMGRSKEIRAVMEILGRRAKNNPVLVGNAGVGKTAIVEGLAEAINKGNVPDVLKGKTVYSLDLGQLMAGTKFRGEFEERMQKLLKFIKEKAGQCILFIDEIHQIVGAGRTEGAMDAANLLKPALARGELHCIGATTQDEYQKYIMKDSALDRRFRAVPVNEPNKEDAIEILMGVREKMEIHHGIKISDEAIVGAVNLSDQYITDKYLPDKAIDLIDEASSALKLSAEAMPAKLAELQAEIRSKMVLAQVEKNNKEILAQIENMKKEFEVGKAKWEKEVLSLKKVSELKNQLERLKFDYETAQINQNYEEASRIRYSLMPEIEKELKSVEHEWILKEVNVAQVISRQTGIPLEKILKSKQDNILGLEKFLKTKVFGQDEALHEISETLIASHAGLSAQNRPLGSFMLLGPSGVGKTETAKALCEFLFGTDQNLIRMDLSEYSEKHSVAKLIGAPAGYVGHEEGGILTEAVRRKPYSVILFDEIEKAHPDFSDILLQILDDGRLTDNKGRTINFKNTILLLTSNSKNIETDFKPEVLGRIDAILYYKGLSQEILKNIIDKEIGLLNSLLKDKKLAIDLDSSCYKELSTRGHDPRYGARPLKSVFNKYITRPLSRKILEGNLPEGKLKVHWKDNDEVEFSAH